MALYEKRTYNVAVGQMGTVLKLYKEEGWPALEAGGFAHRVAGYFVSDTGPLHQLVHLWKFEDDADRRQHWATLFQDGPFMAFAVKLRPLLTSQDVQLLTPAPWGTHP